MHISPQQAYASHTRKQHACQRQKEQQRTIRRNRERQKQRLLMGRLQTPIDHHVPDLYQKIEAILGFLQHECDG